LIRVEWKIVGWWWMLLSCDGFMLDCARGGLCWAVGGDVDLAVDDHFKGRRERGLFVYSATFL